MKAHSSWLLLAYPLLAQANLETSEEQIIVTASRLPQSEASVLAPVIVVERSEIEARQLDALPQLLQTLPGVQLTQFGGRGHYTTLSIRGANSNHTLVLLNGRPMAAGISGTPDLSQFPLGSIERIEYIRGPRAVIYGSDAIGGVINLITNGDEEQIAASVGAGSDGYGRGNLNLNQVVSEKSRVQLQLGYQQSEGYDIEANANQPDEDGFRSQNGLLGFSHQLNSRWNFETTLQGYDNRTESDDPYLISNRTDNQQWQWDGAMRHQGDTWQSRIEASYSESQLESGWEEEGDFHATMPLNTQLSRLSLISSRNLGTQTQLTLGIDGQEERMSEDAKNQFAAPDRNNFGVFALVQGDYQHWLTELALRSDDNQQYGRHNTGAAALGYRLDNAHQLRLSYGTAFKAPTFLDLYYPGYENPDLEPEESASWELSATGRYQSGEWSVNLYHTEISNLISCQSTQSSCQPTNTDASIQGVEVAAAFMTGELSHQLSYDYTDSQDHQQNDQPLLRRAKHKASWLGAIYWGEAELNAEWLYIGSREDLDYQSYPAERAKLPAYQLINLAVNYPLTPALTLGARIDNLFDEDYENALSFNSPGRSWSLNLNYRFD